VTPRAVSASWRLWALTVSALAAALLALWVITSLPIAPVAPNLSSAPDTTAGGVARKIDQVSFPTPEVGWAVVPTQPFWRLVRTTDAGKRWQDVTPPGNGTNGGIAVTVLGPQSAIVVFLAYQNNRDSAFAVTSDGGSDWTAGILPHGASFGPDPIFAVSSQRLWAVLGSGAFISSSNGGGSWAPTALPALASGSCSPTSVNFTSTSTGWISGSCQGIAALWETTDAGLAWRPVVLSSDYSRSARISVAPPRTTTSGGVVTTAATLGQNNVALRVFTESGTVWGSVPAVSLPAGRLIVSFANGTDGWVVDAPAAKGALALAYYTSDGGVNWSFRTTPIPAVEVTALDLLSSQTAVVMAQNGRRNLIWSTADEGLHWTDASVSIFSGPTPRVNGISG
jgi:photosystem II stability/assembly factor-like uncharacterized protein